MKSEFSDIASVLSDSPGTMPVLTIYVDKSKSPVLNSSRADVITIQHNNIVRPKLRFQVFPNDEVSGGIFPSQFSFEVNYAKDDVELFRAFNTMYRFDDFWGVIESDSLFYYRVRPCFDYEVHHGGVVEAYEVGEFPRYLITDFYHDISAGTMKFTCTSPVVLLDKKDAYYAGATTYREFVRVNLSLNNGLAALTVKGLDNIPDITMDYKPDGLTRRQAINYILQMFGCTCRETNYRTVEIVSIRPKTSGLASCGAAHSAKILSPGAYGDIYIKAYSTEDAAGSGTVSRNPFRYLVKENPFVEASNISTTSTYLNNLLLGSSSSKISSYEADVAFNAALEAGDTASFTHVTRRSDSSGIHDLDIDTQTLLVGYIEWDGGGMIRIGCGEAERKPQSALN